MKLSVLFSSVLILLFFTATCSDVPNAEDTMEISGIVAPQGMTSYQYGTHTLTTPETFYALKSDAVNLDDYLDQQVTLIAEKVEGYPIEGGPVYLNVLRVK